MFGNMHFRFVSPQRYAHTMFWAVLLSCLIVAIAASLGRATLNLKAALTEKPDIALYFLLPEEEIGESELIRETEFERDYLAETKHGPALIRLRKGDNQWFVVFEERLHE